MLGPNKPKALKLERFKSSGSIFSSLFNKVSFEDDFVSVFQRKVKDHIGTSGVFSTAVDQSVHQVRDSNSSAAAKS